MDNDGVNLEGMPFRSRFKHITENWLRKGAFIECYKKAEPHSAAHAKVKRLIKVQQKSVLEGRSTGDELPLDKYVNALLGAERDIRRFDGRLFSLKHKIEDLNIPRIDEYFVALTKIAADIGNRTCYYHAGGGTIIRVRGSSVKMYICHNDDFFDYSKRGFFLELYYAPGHDKPNGWDMITLNILKGTDGEMPFHIEVDTHEEAIALLLGRYDEELCQLLLRSVLFGDAVAQDIASSRSINGSLVRADPASFDCMPTETSVMCMLLQQLGAKVDDSLRNEMDIHSFYRISGLEERRLLANYPWLVNAKLVKSSSRSSTNSSIANRSVFFTKQKLFRKQWKRTLIAAFVVSILLGLSLYAILGQSIGVAEKMEKGLTLLLVGILVAVCTVLSARRDEDLLADILSCRLEIKTSRALSEEEFKDFLYLLQKDEKAHESMSKEKAGWVKNEKTGNVRLHRMVALPELEETELLIRENGDLMFADRKTGEDQPNARKAETTYCGLLKVHRIEEKSYGYRIETGKNADLYLE